jgi:Fe-S-cluster-containing dehydrogenase component
VSLLSAVAVEAVEDTPVDRYLAEQADLTAVERFAQRHAAALVPVQARYYQDLLPAAPPGPGQQYAFAVDLDTCTGCKACVAACHSLNGLDDDESWRTVTLLAGGTPEQPYQQTVTAGCHHCVDPACMNGCPVDAYEKDPVTGIVVHLDDQCIGCRYCTLACPYDVPVYNNERGIVRKCDMCAGRLAEGEAPACVQACPNAAIAITVVDVAGVARTGTLVPGAPSSSITVPTTQYRTQREQPAVVYSARGTRPHAHTPLAVMLVLTQLSVGAFTTDVALRLGGALDSLVAVAAGLIALGASVLHLGRPRYAYRAVIGIRHSWLSREVVAFGAFTGLATLSALAGSPVLGWAAAACGLFGVLCSVLIYTTTHRWHPVNVVGRFTFTTVLGGLAVVTWAALPAGWLTVVGWALALIAVTALSLHERQRFFLNA